MGLPLKYYSHDKPYKCSKVYTLLKNTTVKKGGKYTILKDDLPILQKQVIKALGTQGPQTQNQVIEYLKKDGKGVRLAFKALEKSNLIKIFGKKEYRNQKFDVYWLNTNGMGYAILFSVSREILKEYAFQLAKEDEIADLDFFFKMAEVLSPRKFLSMLAFFDKVDKKNFVPQTMPFSLSEKEMIEYGKLLLEHPTSKQIIKKVIKSYSDLLDEDSDKELNKTDS